LISGIFWKGSPHKVLQAWIDEKFELVVSEEILMEYSRILKEFEKKRSDYENLAKSWILFIAQYATFINVKKKVKVCRDPDDDMFLSCAVSANAKFIVSGDKDLLDLKEYLNVKIMDASSFLKELK